MLKMSVLKCTNFAEDDSWDALDEAELVHLLDQPSAQAQSAAGTTHRLRNDKEHTGFDNNAGDTWIYPKNLPVRAYQYSISQVALYRNTLVVLPTGLGKTFIAAVVMYNLYRWYPTGKVIFMAPTRPLVAQQIEACQKIMPFPPADTVELTGRLPKQKRAELWQSKRVFFATPQVVHSDMIAVDAQALFPFEQVKLLVFDEAHKARGRYAYTEVSHMIFARNRHFRVLALSATPGRTMEDIAGVCRQLYISHLEVRWETSIDVMPYVHHRTMKTIQVPLSSEIRDLRMRLLDIIDPYVRQLIDADVVKGDLANINRNYLLFEQKRFRDRNQRERHPQYGMISSNFSTCISLYHALELLERQGLRVFVSNFEQDEAGNSKFVLTLDRRLRDLVDEVKQQLGPNPFDCSAPAMTDSRIAQLPQVLDFGHPKFEKARQCVINHFKAHPDSRAIVFCEYRESVMLIYRLLQQHGPLLKPRCFVGQGGTTGPLRALTQKQQLQTMSDFRSGKNNILVATSIGEEGIDVGEVELIVCFDISSSNPQRFVQRIGRTGRKKNGNVVMLVTEGREAQLLKEVLAHKDDINKKLLRSSVVKEAFYKQAPRLVPIEFEPKCLQTLFDPVLQTPAATAAVAAESTEPPSKKAKPGRKKVNKSPEKVKGSQDLRKFFKQTPPPLDADEQNVFEAPATLSTQMRDQLHKSVGVLDNFLLPLTKTQQLTPSSHASMQPAEPKSLDAQHLRRLNKMLQATKPLLNAAQRSNDLLTQLRSKSLPRYIKVRILQASLGFVREVCDKMQVLQALDTSSDEMSSEEQRIRADYELVCAQFADAQALTAFLEEQSALQTSCKSNDLPALAAHAQEADFAAAAMRIFADLPEPDYCVDNFAYEVKAWQEIEARRMERTRYEQSLCLPGESMIYNGCALTGIEDMSEEQLADFAETKYQSQLLDDTNDDSVKSEQCSNDVSLKQSSPTAEHDGSSTLSDQDLLTTLQIIEPMSKCCSTPAAKPLRRPNVNASTPLAITRAPEDNEAALRLPVDAPHSAVDGNRKQHLLEGLELNMDDFLEPFPEEILLTLTNLKEPIPGELVDSLMPSPSPTSSEHKENRNTSNNTNQALPPNTAKYYANNNNVKLVMRHSPDLFNDTISPVKPIAMKSSSLAAKLAAKCKPAALSVAKTTFVPSAQMLKSPQSRAKTDNTKNDKSPSVFDIYLQNMSGRAKSSPKQIESPLVRSRASAKRKIIESDSDVEEKAAKVPQQMSPEASSNSDSDFESVPATQMPRASFQVHRQKRRKQNSFIDCEAVDSGSNASDDEAEHTIGTYLKDSVLVSSDDSSEEDEAARSRVHVMYLQATRSPHARPGAFKIPQARVYNDAVNIFSQTLPPPSQYESDSFVVSGNDDDDEHLAEAQDASLCPLERAERILKQDRRDKRRQQRQQRLGLIPAPKRRRVQCLANSSSSDDDAD